MMLNVYIRALRKKSAPLPPEGTVKWCCCQGKNFYGTRDTVGYLKTFRVIFNEIPVLFLMLMLF